MTISNVVVLPMELNASSPEEHPTHCIRLSCHLIWQFFRKELQQFFLMEHALREDDDVEALLESLIPSMKIWMKQRSYLGRIRIIVSHYPVIQSHEPFFLDLSPEILVEPNTCQIHRDILLDHLIEIDGDTVVIGRVGA